MIIKLQKIINCSSEHPSYPASNLLHNPPPAPWKCAKPGELIATVTFELPEPTCIIGLDVGNFHSCIVVVTASTYTNPENWVPIVNHQFLTHDEATNNKFKDQVQLFTKNELNSDTLKIKFDRVKVTCMQSANLKELFGLCFFILRTEVIVNMGVDIFGRFKLKNDETEKTKSEFKKKYLRLFPEKQKSFKEDLVKKMKEGAVEKFNKRQEEEQPHKKRPLFQKMETGKSDKIFGKRSTNDSSLKGMNSPPMNAKFNNVVRTPFGDIIQLKEKVDNETSTRHKIKLINSKDDDNNEKNNTSNAKCTVCLKSSQHTICQTCKKLPEPISGADSPLRKKAKVIATPKMQFSKLLEDVTFSLSGYVNPHREEIRRKALKMGARYIADPNTTNNKCTHLICAFNNTPKFQRLKGHTKIVSHIFIEECFDHKKRYPWRRYALFSREKKQPESEEEIEGTTSPVHSPNPYDQDTDTDSDTDY